MALQDPFMRPAAMPDRCENVKGWVGDKYHIWNRVELDGVWKYVDVTWNNMAGENNWLLISREEMNEDRVEEVIEKAA